MYSTLYIYKMHITWLHIYKGDSTGRALNPDHKSKWTNIYALLACTVGNIYFSSSLFYSAAQQFTYIYVATEY